MDKAIFGGGLLFQKGEIKTVEIRGRKLKRSEEAQNSSSFFLACDPQSAVSRAGSVSFHRSRSETSRHLRADVLWAHQQAHLPQFQATGAIDSACRPFSFGLPLGCKWRQSGSYGHGLKVSDCRLGVQSLTLGLHLCWLLGKALRGALQNNRERDRDKGREREIDRERER